MVLGKREMKKLSFRFPKIPLRNRMHTSPGQTIELAHHDRILSIQLLLLQSVEQSLFEVSRFGSTAFTL
jgi:hypothetical protein